MEQARGRWLGAICLQQNAHPYRKTVCLPLQGNAWATAICKASPRNGSCVNTDERSTLGKPSWLLLRGRPNHINFGSHQMGCERFPVLRA